MFKNILLPLILLAFSWLTNAQDFKATPIVIDSDIHGDLYLSNPKSDLLSIVIAGSGPTDRNGNQPPMLTTNAYKLLAEGLAKKKINTFTFDKRMLAQIKKQDVKEENMRFQDLSIDLDLIINHFKKSYSKIVLIGHSEGALVATMNSNNPSVQKVILLAGQGETIDHIISDQITKSAPFLSKKADEILKELKQGKQVEDVIPLLQSFFRPSVQPYLISWIQVDPIREVQKTDKSLLIVQGTKDLQVDLKQGEKLHQAKPAAKLITLDGMNHVLKKVTTDAENQASYAKSHYPLHPELVSILANFITE